MCKLCQTKWDLKEIDQIKRIAITNRHLCQGDFLEKIEQICASKPKPHRLILREKDLSPKAYFDLAQKCSKVTQTHNLTAHFFWKEARTLGLQRIHLPMFLFLNHISEIRKDFTEIGVSVHSLEEALQAETQGADYVIYGHVFETDCKKDLPPRGLGELEEICRLLTIPVYGLGGITPENETSVLKVGASGVCQMSSYMK